MSTPRSRLVLFLATLLAGAATARLHAQQPQPLIRPSTRELNCTISGCHAAESNRKFLHGPNAVQACDACHEYKDEKGHTFELKRQGRQLCDFCHIDKTGTEGTVVHKPFADGNCLGCHDPHGANNRRMLKKDTTPELCTTCHKDTVHGSNVHKPVSEDCANCHKPHTSNIPKLLTKPSRELCLSCHENVGHEAEGAKFPHDPLKGECLQCHTPHATNQIKALKAAPAELCATCHKAVLEKAQHSSHPHSAVTDVRACLNCHTPHGSTREKQLAADPIASCLACHSKPIVVSKDHVVSAVPEVAKGAGGLHQHGPIEKDDCAGCHTVHGGDQDRLLTGNYTKSFYQPYSDDAYQFCYKCHDKALITGQKSDKQTGFRNGLQNLHAVHVDSATQGRSCRACHTVHASRFDAQIADSVQFGQWKLPINFKTAENGGSCSPGCHKPATYDRTKPATAPQGPALTPPPAAPASPAAKPVAPAVPAAKPGQPATGSPGSK